MDGCGVCGATDQFLYRCELCRAQYCQAHQQPSDHPCPVAPYTQAIFSAEPAPAANEPEPAANPSGGPEPTAGATRGAEPAVAPTRGPSPVARASARVEHAWSELPERAAIAMVAIVLVAMVAGGAFVAFQPTLNDVLPFGGGPQPPADAVPAEEVNESEVGRMVASLVNGYRSEQEVPPLAYDGALAEIAKYHSDDMASEGYVGHTAPDGETVVDRYEGFGYDCESPGQLVLFTEYASHIRTENGTIPIYNEPQLGVGIFELWLESPEHREALLTQSWDDVGVGITITDEDLVYVTLNAC